MKEIVVTEYQDIRVLTSQQLAEAYGTENQVITNNYNRNKERYSEGKHYICLQGEEKARFINKNQNDFSSFAKSKSIYLWTEKGTFLHAKSLNTDTAWEVYDRLVDTYFLQRNNQLDGLSTELQAVIVVDKRVTKIEQRIERLEFDIPLYGSEADELSNHIKRKGVAAMDGKGSNSYKDTKIRATVYADIYNQIKREFGICDDNGRYISYKALKRRYIPEAHELVDCYELPTYLEERVHDCNAQINMEVA